MACDPSFAEKVEAAAGGGGGGGGGGDEILFPIEALNGSKILSVDPTLPLCKC